MLKNETQYNIMFNNSFPSQYLNNQDIFFQIFLNGEAQTTVKLFQAIKSYF